MGQELSEIQQSIFKDSRPAAYSHYIDKLDAIAKAYIEGEAKYATKKRQVIFDMRDTFLLMSQHGYYDLPKSSICASICKKIRQFGGDENSDAYVRMCLDDEYKDKSHTTFDSIYKKSLRVGDDPDRTLSFNEINVFEPIKPEFFAGMTADEITLFKSKFSDIIKESKRRTRENRERVDEALKAALQNFKIDAAMNDETKNFPNMNDTCKNILNNLRETVKNTKKINRFMNMILDKVTNDHVTENIYNQILLGIFDKATELNNMTNDLVTKINGPQDKANN
jgi:hypothetical protein